MKKKLTVAIVHRRHSSKSFKIFAEEAGIRKVHVIGNLSNLLVGIAQLHLYGINHRLVNPLLSGLAADIPHDGAHIARSNVKMRGVKVETMTLRGILPYKADESCEQLLLA